MGGSCGVASDGSAHCCGWAGTGAIGSGRVEERGYATPQPVAGGIRFESVESGAYFHCGRSGGAGYCWGTSTAGQLGAGPDVRFSAFPTEVVLPRPEGVVAAAARRAGRGTS